MYSVQSAQPLIGEGICTVHADFPSLALSGASPFSLPTPGTDSLFGRKGAWDRRKPRSLSPSLGRGMEKAQKGIDRIRRTSGKKPRTEALRSS